MDDTLFGLTVLRSVPQDTVWGLMSGQYTLHGGVIRWAAGTEYAGQIVRHLIPASGVQLPFTGPSPLGIGSIVRNADFTLMTRQVLQIATGTMLLSGLNLAVSTINFTVLSHQLHNIDKRLQAIQTDVRAVRELLERNECAKLRAALETLQNSNLIEDKSIRQQMFVDSYTVFSKMVQVYRELFIFAKDVEIALATEEYYCLIMLARARCSAELGQFKLSEKELTSDMKFWTEQSRQVARDFLIGKNPERFLFQEMTDVVPTAALVEWLDFANNDSKGYGWVDVLRGDMPPWRRDIAINLDFPWDRWKSRELAREREVVVPGLTRLTARHRVLEGHTAQLALLQRLNATPSEFERRLEQLAPLAVDGFLIVEQPA